MPLVHRDIGNISFSRYRRSPMSDIIKESGEERRYLLLRNFPGIRFQCRILRVGFSLSK
jgi:hypothetical protein